MIVNILAGTIYTEVIVPQRIRAGYLKLISLSVSYLGFPKQLTNKWLFKNLIRETMIHATFSLCKMPIIYNITTERQFKRLVSKNDTINVLNFWATWAEPCKQMNQVFSELADKFPSLTYIQVSSEQGILLQLVVYKDIIDRSRGISNPITINECGICAQLFDSQGK